MRKINLILLGLIITINLSAQTNRRMIELSGNISDKYPIGMTLTFNGEQVLGFYFYEKFNTRILLEGQIIGEKITLLESPDEETDFRVGFIGVLKGDSITGVWMDKDKNKTLIFKIIINTDNIVTISKTISNIEGTYENIQNSDKFSGSIDLKYISDDLFCFEISNGKESGCVGYIKGLIKLIDFKNGKYSDDLCEALEITLLNNIITVTENKCEFHGMNCWFDGTYKK